MADSGGAGEGQIISGINVTPLVDVMMVLLVIFIVTAKIVVTPTVPLELPEARQTEETQVVFSVIMPKAGPTLINGAAAPTDEEVTRLATEASAKDRDVRAIINADGGVPHRRVMHMLDLLKGARIYHIAFGAVAVAGEAR